MAIRLPETSSPRRDPGIEVLDRDQAADTQLLVVAASGEVVEHRRIVTAVRQMQGGRPPEVPVSAEHQNSHNSTLSNVIIVSVSVDVHNCD